MRLWVEDDGLAAVARALGHDVTAGSVADVRAALLSGPDAWNRVRSWRAAGHTVPVIIHTAAAPALDRPRLEPVVLLRTLDADALQTAIGMGSVGSPAGRVALEGGVADLDRRVFELEGGGDVSLSPLECRFVGYLAARSGRAITRDELQLQVWDHTRPLATRAVHMLVTRLRRKIEADPKHPGTLLTAPGGYRLLLRSTRRPTARLPELVGRTALLSETEAALRATGALVLVGPAGVGKTALARTLAEQLSARGHEVELLDEVDAESWSRAVGTRRGLLLGTSRFVIPGVACRGVPPLTPEASESLFRRLAEREGVHVETGRVETLLAESDGLPEAIVEQARRLRALGDEEEGPGIAAAIAGSWARLERPAQDLLVALATVLGPVDAQIAGALCRDVSDAGVFAAWQQLVDGHLLIRRDGRFWLLHGVRHFVERHATIGWEAAFEDHMSWMHGEVSSALARSRGPDAKGALAQMLARAKDIERAWNTAVEASDPRVVELTFALDQVLTQSGHREERRQRLDEALEAVDDPTGQARLSRLRANLDRHRDRRGSRDTLRRVAQELWEARPDEATLAACQSARLSCNIDPITDILAWIRAQARRTLGDRERWLLRLRELELLDFAGELDSASVQREMLKISDDLAEHGELVGAVDAGMSAAVRMSLTGLGDPVGTVSRIVGWARLLPDPVVLASALVNLSGRLGEALRTDEALEALEEAGELFARVEPIRRWQVTQYRGFALANGGRHSDARQELESYLEWCRSQASMVSAPDVRLWLAGLELDALEPRRALVHAEAVLDTTQRSGNTNHTVHAWMHRAHALLLLGRRAEAAECVARLDEPAYDYERLKMALLRSAVVLEGPDPLELAAQMSGRTGEFARAIMAAGPDGLVRFGTTAGGGMLAVRLLAQIRALT